MVAAVVSDDNPDAWIDRNPAMWRHGKWNAETPMDLLETHGFVTPSDLYFIRAHAAVPIRPSKNIENEHTIEICGEYTKTPQTFTLKDLKTKFPKRELWSCLVCSGQRRLELNLIKKGAGHIDWHNATGNAKWTGVYLRDVLTACNVDVEKARHCEFYGKDSYQTSIPFTKCIDVSGYTMLAWAMNDEELPFDHGYPLRVVVPGWSSKCSAKWIHKISVQEKETEAHMYHRYYKWFPKFITSSTTQLEDILKTPPVTELNTNAVAFRPRNGTKALKGPLKLSGYCYTGGGRPVNRIEVSVDNDNWLMCTKVREELTPHGQCYAWVLWEVTITDFDPVKHKEIIVRAFDCSAQGMTPGHEWNLTGMMNNAYFRIKVANIGGQMIFQHPTTWMDPEKAKVLPESAAPTFQWSGDPKVLNGAWTPGESLAPVTLSSDTKGTFQTQEKIYGGENLKGSVTDMKAGKIFAQFGPFFQVGGTIKNGCIEWNNGAVWSKL